MIYYIYCLSNIFSSDALSSSIHPHLDSGAAAEYSLGWSIIQYCVGSSDEPWSVKVDSLLFAGLSGQKLLSRRIDCLPRICKAYKYAKGLYTLRDKCLIRH